MKISYKIACACLALTVFAGCSSNKNLPAEESADSYVSEDFSSGTERTAVSKTSDAAKKSAFSLKNIFKSKFIEYDDGSIFTTKALGGIKQNKTDIVIYPKKKLAGYGSTYMAAYYNILFDETARGQLAKAVDRYFSEFENKKLDRTGKNTQRAYGRIKGHMVWGSIKGNTPNYADCIIHLGYKFVDKSPYFTISIDHTTNEAFMNGTSSMEESLQLHYFMTKNQASSLVACLSEDRIREQFELYEIELYGTKEDLDSYENYDDYEYDEVPEADEVTETVDYDENEK